MHARRTLTLLATLSSLAVAGVAGAGAASADAATTAKLSIPYSDCVNSQGRHFDYVMRVAGTTDFVARSVKIQLLGEDEWFDDDLATYVLPASPFAGPYIYDFCVNSSTLDEDWGEDEVYAKVNFTLPNGQVRAIRTNTIHGYF